MSPKKEKAVMDEDEEVGEDVFSSDVLEVVELYKQVASASADSVLVPTSEDVRAMALTVFIERHRNARTYTPPPQTPRGAPAPSNSGATSPVNVESASESRACAGPSCGGQTLTGKTGERGPYWYCSKCRGFTNVSPKTGQTYFKASTRNQ